MAATKRVLCHPIGVEYDLVDRACVKFFELSRRLYVDASFPPLFSSPFFILTLVMTREIINVQVSLSDVRRLK